MAREYSLEEICIRIALYQESDLKLLSQHLEVPLDQNLTKQDIEKKIGEHLILKKGKEEA
jgi:hypothetical protein